MATRRQREAPAPRPAANAGPRNQTAAAAARSGPRNQTAAAATAAPSGPRNQTAAAAAATCRPDARNRRALGDIGNHVNAPVVDGEANRRHFTRSLSTQPNAAAADENTIAPARPAAVEGVRASSVGWAVSGKNNKLSKGATTRVTRTRAKTDATADSLMERVAAAEAKAARAVEETKRIDSMFKVLGDKYVKLGGHCLRYISEATQTLDKLRAMVDKQESELKKVSDLNMRLFRLVDLKEAQLLAMSDQCKALALHSN